MEVTRGIMRLDWDGVAFLALIIAISYQAIFRRPPKPSITKRSLTLRIEGIPTEKSSEALKRDLKSIIEQDTKLKDDSVAIVQHFLVPRDHRVACATATIRTSVAAKEVVKRLHQAGSSYPYCFDTVFHGITPLYENHGGADVDIIAVPGLGSHALGSWKSPNNNDVWLRDYLPDDVPNIRVLLYGYDTSLLNNESKDSIEDLGSRFLESLKAFRADTTYHRPIIFIGHSLGGLLIKEALVLAHKRSDDLQNLAVCNACYGLLLFGVPNLGLRNYQLESIVQGRPNQVLIRDLVVDGDSEASPFLKRVSNEFSNYCKGRYQVISFFERQRSSTVQIQPDGTLAKTGPKTFMVTQKSATSAGLTAVADENNISLNTDHSGLVKYETRTQVEYSIVKAKLQALVAEAKREVGRQQSMENSLRPEQKRLWNSLNQPPYTSFRNSTKLAKPERGTLEWLIQPGIGDQKSKLRNKIPSQDSLTKKDFASWRDLDNSTSLLVTAPPGRGKSVLSNFVLGHLESKVHQDPSTTTKVIYYFCNIKNDEASRNARSVLRALIVQLCEHQQRLFQILPPEYETNSDRFFSAPFDTLWHVFESMLRNGAYTHIQCVIDGLDVYQEEMDDLVSQLIEVFSSYERNVGPVLKLLCTSRPEKAILSRWGSRMHRILRCNQDDLDIFINTRVESLGENFTNNMRKIVMQQLRMQADGTFLWLEVVLRRIQLVDAPTSRKVKEIVKDSPLDLDSLYETLVKRLVNKDRDNARLLALVIYARCPLDLKVLEDAMAIDPTRTYTNYRQCSEDRPRLVPGEMHKAFGTLLDIIEGTIYIVHQSVKDYFKRQDPLKDFTEIAPRLILAHVSMAYLSLEDFGRCKLKTINLKQEYPLLSYAAKYWFSHIEVKADIMQSAELQRFLKEIIHPDSRNARVWIQIAARYCRSYPSRVSEVALLFDIGWLAELLLDRSITYIHEDFKKNCLSSASEHKGSVLRVLLEHRRGVKFPINIVTVCRIAEYHHKDMITVLLDRRGDEIQIMQDVVIAATRNRDNSKDVMELLLDRRGDEVQITQEVVIAAAESYYGKDIMELLLDRRRDEVQITQEVVVAAAGNYSKDIMELLLDRYGDEVHITQEVVVVAVGNHNKDIMELLLDRRGDEVQITQEVVIAAAERYYSKDIMELLLDRRRDEVQITQEVVVAAAGNHNKDIMELLLDRYGDEVHITQEVVVVAVGNHSKDIMELLLDRRGDEVQITQEVVVAAAGNRNKDIIELLLDRRGDEVQITQEVVVAATKNRYGKNIVELLLDRRGDEVQITQEVVVAAVKNYDSKDIMELLLDRRGDAVQITQEVMVAAAENCKEVMTLLLDRRGDEIQITQEVVVAAAGNVDGGKDIMELLLDRRRDKG